MAMAFLLPLTYALTGLGQRRGWFQAQTWLLYVVFAGVHTATLILSYISGQAAEFLSSADTAALAAHQTQALWMTITGGLLFASAFLLMVGRLKKWPVHGACVIFMATQIYLALQTGHMGGALVPR